jgi:hypothetical protein
MWRELMFSIKNATDVFEAELNGIHGSSGRVTNLRHISLAVLDQKACHLGLRK